MRNPFAGIARRAGEGLDELRDALSPLRGDEDGQDEGSASASRGASPGGLYSPAPAVTSSGGFGWAPVPAGHSPAFRSGFRRMGRFARQGFVRHSL